MEISRQERIIHFLPDEKVTNNFISMLEAVYPGESRYVVIGGASKAKMTNLTTHIEYYSYGAKELSYVIANLSTYQKVFIHGLSLKVGYDKIRHKNLVWVIWGGDLYEAFLSYKGYRIYIDENEQYQVRASQSPIGKLPVWLYKTLVGIRDFINFKKAYKIISKIKGIIAIDEDYNLLKRYCPELQIVHYPFFSYYPIEKQIGIDNLDKECYGRNIWVGNSPALNGNHSSIFKLLKNFPTSTKVYCPISYGESRLINHVDKVGKEILGQRFVPLKEFMKAEKYFELYLDANAFIFGHLRQCGFGSVLMALYFGGKCFLYSDAPLYKYFKRNRVVIFSIENDLNYAATQIPLTKEERLLNREFVKSLCSAEAIKKQMKEVFS